MTQTQKCLTAIAQHEVTTATIQDACEACEEKKATDTILANNVVYFLCTDCRNFVLVQASH